jgi:hypothetical protein
MRIRFSDLTLLVFPGRRDFERRWLTAVMNARFS